MKPVYDLDQYNLILHLWRTTDLSQRKIAQAVGVSRYAVSKAVGSAERKPSPYERKHMERRATDRLTGYVHIS